jgi:hypothetical protein
LERNAAVAVRASGDVGIVTGTLRLCIDAAVASTAGV